MFSVVLSLAASSAANEAVSQTSAAVGQSSAALSQTSTALSQTSTALSQTSTALSQSSAAVSQSSSALSQSSAAASMVGGLILVLAVIFLLAFLVRRFNLMPAANSAIKTLAATSVGQRERLVLVELEGQQYLLGVTASQITLIDKLTNQVSLPQTSFAKGFALAKARQAKADESDTGSASNAASTPTTGGTA